MGDTDLFISIGSSAGDSARIVAGDDDWVRGRIGSGGPGATVLLRPSSDTEADVEGHASSMNMTADASGAGMQVQAAGEDGGGAPAQDGPRLPNDAGVRPE